MKTVAWLLTLMAVAAWAYIPLPVQKSKAELELQAALEAATTDSAKLALAKASLEANPEDMAAGRIAQDVMLRLMDDAAQYFKSRAEGSDSPAAHYFYGRASRDSTIMAQEAQWIVGEDAGSYWGHELRAMAEWYRAKPDTGQIHREFAAAIAADPSRPEAYLELGWFFEDEERWSEAREVLEAGAACDPAEKEIRDARLTAYAELRDAEAFFDLMKGVFSDRPLEADLPMAKGEGRFTSDDLRGHPTVLEYWAYT